MENELKLNNQEKDLLLQDLSSRLPYRVRCDVGDNKPYTLSGIEIDDKNGHLLDFEEKRDGLDMQVYLSECRPYLFPLSSMTKEQEMEYGSLVESDINGIWYDTVESIDYLIANYFDYRGLIPMGLAKDATGLNIY